MKFVYAVQNEAELEKYSRFSESVRERLYSYICFLAREYQVRELPRTIVLTNRETATELISDIPVPAYTNEYRVVMTPDREVWSEIYRHQLDGLDHVEDLLTYYENELTESHILQILGHELAHHSELFPDDFDEDDGTGIWFEEGMVEYISRRYFLSPDQYQRELEINQKIVALLTPRYGNHSLEEFGKETYSGDYASIFFEYWRSFLAVHQIVNHFGGDVLAVFRSYRAWHESNSGKSLSEWCSV